MQKQHKDATASTRTGHLELLPFKHHRACTAYLTPALLDYWTITIQLWRSAHRLDEAAPHHRLDSAAEPLTRIITNEANVRLGLPLDLLGQLRGGHDALQRHLDLHGPVDYQLTDLYLSVQANQRAPDLEFLVVRGVLQPSTI